MIRIIVKNNRVINSLFLKIVFNKDMSFMKDSVTK